MVGSENPIIRAPIDEIRPPVAWGGGKLSERLHGGGLFGSDLARLDFGDKEVLAPAWRTGKAPHHGQLTYVGQGVGDGTLKEGLGGGIEGLVRSEIGVECMQTAEESLQLGYPGIGPGGTPAFVALD